MSHSQFHCTGRVYLDLHGLIFETSICYWQDQPGSPLSLARARARAWGCVRGPAAQTRLGGGAKRVAGTRLLSGVSRNIVLAGAHAA